MSCLETYATLRIFSETLHADEVTRRLGVQPTKRRPINPESKYRHERESHYWGWSSDRQLTSTEGLDHIRAVIELLRGKEEALKSLQRAGCQTDLCCYWVSSGQGGPFLDVEALSALSSLGLEIWWDVYFCDPQDYENGAQGGEGNSSKPTPLRGAA